MADTGFEQIETILKVVLPQLLNGKRDYFHRNLIVTTEIKDIAVSAKLVRVHPEWAVELGPLKACEQIIARCAEFDERMQAARDLHIAELRNQLRTVTEKIRNVGAESLIDELKSLPVPRHRALVKVSDEQ